MCKVRFNGFRDFHKLPMMGKVLYFLAVALAFTSIVLILLDIFEVLTGTLTLALFLNVCGMLINLIVRKIYEKEIL